MTSPAVVVLVVVLVAVAALLIVAALEEVGLVLRRSRLQAEEAIERQRAQLDVVRTQRTVNRVARDTVEAIEKTAL
ncbi:MAG: hypothetical protein Q8K58_10230 [Acidimicrobiales bacterium]|nr:hypothetical protein [Acidimicrobiales bacterium]